MITLNFYKNYYKWWLFFTDFLVKWSTWVTNNYELADGFPAFIKLGD